MTNQTAQAKQVELRRTFAIISHPDAGKTTITEKVLLFGQALQRAGTVKGKKSGQHAKSDWMEMEKERGISITTSVMQFPYKDCLVNLLEILRKCIVSFFAAFIVKFWIAFGNNIDSGTIS